MNILVPTAYLPPVGYMACLVSCEARIEVCETYPKQTIRNHCIIYGPNGSQQLSVPVERVNGNHTATKDIRISNHQDWQRIHWRTIETAYNNSPFFLFYRDYFQPVYERTTGWLTDLNDELLQIISSCLKVELKTSFTEKYERSPEGITDLRKERFRHLGAGTSAFHRYPQVFEPVHGFITNLSIIDLIFNLGPESLTYLRSIQPKV